MAAHLRARPSGGLTHAEDRLVLQAVQPAGGQLSAADPSHHGDVAVSEEAMQKMRQADRIGKRVERVKKEQWRGSKHKINAGSWVSSLQGLLPGPKGIRRQHLQSVSRAVQVYHKQTDWWDVWTSLSAQDNT